MTRRLASVFAALLCFLFLFGAAGCYRTQPEPLWEDENAGKHVQVNSLTIDGINFILYSDHTASVEGIDPGSFSGTSLLLPDYVEEYPIVEIVDGAFREMTVTDVTLPAKLETIGDEAFRHGSMTKIVLPDTLTHMGKDAFSDCRKLTSLTLGKGLTEIPLGAFYGCVSLKEVTVPEGVVTIGEEAFSKCEALEKISLPASLREIGAFAFWNTGTDDLTFEIPEGVTAIGAGAFRGTAWLEGQTDEFMTVGDSVLIRYNGTETEVTVPEGVKFLSDAFAGTAVSKVILPRGVKECENCWEETPGIEVVRG